MLAQVAFSIQNIEGFIVRIDKADAMGPVLDPTLWRETHRRVDAMRKVAQAALKLQSAVEEFRVVLEETDHLIRTATVHRPSRG